MGHKGTKGPLLRLLVCDQVVADVKEAPRPVRSASPSPQPREPGRGSGPRAAPGCGIRGQIRRRSVLATQMSWIGKWGWGEETHPAIPEGGSARRWGLGGSWGLCGGPLGSSSGDTEQHGASRGHQGGLPPPSSTWGCSSRSPYNALTCDCPQCGTVCATVVASWLPAFWPHVPQPRIAGAGTPGRF